MTHTKKTVADSLKLLRRGKPLSGADRANICKFIDALTETNIRQAAAVKDLLEKPENQLAFENLKQAEFDREDLRKEMNALDVAYSSLVEACKLNCDEKTLEQLATVTQERCLLKDYDPDAVEYEDL